MLFPESSTRSKIPRVAYMADGRIYGGDVSRLLFDNEDDVMTQAWSSLNLKALEQGQEIGFECPATLQTEGLLSSVDCDERWYSVKVVGIQSLGGQAASRRIVQQVGCG
jgi:hypothetical protein